MLHVIQESTASNDNSSFKKYVKHCDYSNLDEDTIIYNNSSSQKIRPKDKTNI